MRQLAAAFGCGYLQGASKLAHSKAPFGALLSKKYGIDTILFDWDGTLIDTADAAFDAFRKALLDLSVPLEYETYVRIYSPNWYSMYEALALLGKGGPTPITYG